VDYLSEAIESGHFLITHLCICAVLPMLIQL
jgi:hypothetical protein